MTWTNVTKPTQGDATKKSLIDAMIDNDTHLYNVMGGAGTGAGGSLQNGSFENDTDSDNVPDGWTETLGAGASLAFDTTTPAHGLQAIKFTTAGSTDNYVTTDDYILCAVQKPLVVDFLTKSSGAGVAAKVDVLWYDKDEAYISTTTLYTEGTASPTSWTRYLRGVMPPTGAVYCKVRLYGGIAGDNTAGDVYFDGVELSTTDSLMYNEYGTISEQTDGSGSEVEEGTCTFWLPQNLSANGRVLVTFVASSKGTVAGGGSDPGSVLRFRIGAFYSGYTSATSDGNYHESTFTIDITGTLTGGSTTLYLRHNSQEAGDTSYAKKDVSWIRVEVLNW